MRWDQESKVWCPACDDRTVMKSPIDSDLIVELRQCIYLCRMFRKAAMRRKDWHVEIAAEQRLNQSRKLYKAALELGDKSLQP